jgi:SpoVK/Ycf46/Vps4 family AAA+-type ATPase
MRHAVVLLDEADALFSKHTDVKSSDDRHANLEVNDLLQRMESFAGITILATAAQAHWIGLSRQDDSVRCVTLPSFMTNRKTTKRAVATSDLDPATLAKVNMLKRQRQRMNRTLLKRRRKKSGQ